MYQDESIRMNLWSSVTRGNLPLYLFLFRTKIDDFVGQNIGIRLAIVTYYGNAVKLVFISNIHILWMNELCYSILIALLRKINRQFYKIQTRFQVLSFKNSM